MISTLLGAFVIALIQLVVIALMIIGSLGAFIAFGCGMFVVYVIARLIFWGRS